MISLWEIKSHLMKGQYRDANEKYFTLMIGTAPHTFLTRLAKTEERHLLTHSFVLLYHTKGNAPWPTTEPTLRAETMELLQTVKRYLFLASQRLGRAEKVF